MASFDATRLLKRLEDKREEYEEGDQGYFDAMRNKLLELPNTRALLENYFIKRLIAQAEGDIKAGEEQLLSKRDMTVEERHVIMERIAFRRSFLSEFDVAAAEAALTETIDSL